MTLLDFIKRSVVEKAYKYGLILTPEALEYLISLPSIPERLFLDLKRRGVTIVTYNDIVKDEKHDETEKEVEHFYPKTRNCKGRVRMVFTPELEEDVPSDPEREKRDILMNRLEILRKVIEKRYSFESAEYSKIERGGDEKYTTGIILQKRATEKGVVIGIENGDEYMEVLITNPSLFNLLDSDMVIGLKTSKKGSVVVSDTVLFPGFIWEYSENCGIKVSFYSYPSPRDVENAESDVIIIDGVVDVRKINDIKRSYREIDEVISSVGVPVIVMPSYHDAVRQYPPILPIDDDLMPESHQSFNVIMAGKPSYFKIGEHPFFVADYKHIATRNLNPEVYPLSLLSYPVLSSLPYLSHKDYIMKDPPRVVVGGVNKKKGETLFLEVKTYSQIDI